MIQSFFRFRCTLFLALLCLSAGCAPQVRFLERSSSDRYNDVLARWTQEQRYFGLENVEYTTFVTYRTPELRKAYVKEYAAIYRLPQEKADALLKSELDEAARYDVFLVSHYSTNANARKLRPEANVWRLALTFSTGPDRGVEPDLVETEPSGKDPVLTFFYPYVTLWSSNYLVKFKRQEGNPLRFEMAGVMANLTFTFDRNTEKSDGTDHPR